MVTACAQTKEIAALFQQGTDPFVPAKQCAADWLFAVVALGIKEGKRLFVSQNTEQRCSYIFCRHSLRS